VAGDAAVCRLSISTTNGGGGDRQTADKNFRRWTAAAAGLPHLLRRNIAKAGNGGGT
jgi:hypothetical protein